MKPNNKYNVLYFVFYFLILILDFPLNERNTNSNPNPNPKSKSICKDHSLLQSCCVLMVPPRYRLAFHVQSKKTYHLDHIH